MPLYDYRCPTCDLTFEVSRSFADADVPAYCPMCETLAKRELSLPMTTFTRGAAAEAARTPPAWSGGSKWSHHGHSHGPGTGGHAH